LLFSHARERRRRQLHACATHDAWHEPGKTCCRTRSHVPASPEVRKRYEPNGGQSAAGADGPFESPSGFSGRSTLPANRAPYAPTARAATLDKVKAEFEASWKRRGRGCESAVDAEVLLEQAPHLDLQGLIPLRSRRAEPRPALLGAETANVPNTLRRASSRSRAGPTLVQALTFRN
jgi:hypothetical protein